MSVSLFTQFCSMPVLQFCESVQCAATYHISLVVASEMAVCFPTVPFIYLFIGLGFRFLGYFVSNGNETEGTCKRSK